ncbi:putative beta-glucosidase E [Alicycliphilus sp. B1]|nr:putative beta-glucosidase E [Alicycliphilus sp. B1]
MSARRETWRPSSPALAGAVSHCASIPGGIVPADHGDERGRVEEAVAHEQRQVATDAILVARNDVGVAPHQRQRNAPKERRHREPVGQRADHRGLGHGLQAIDPQAARREVAGGEDRGEQHEQRERQAPGPGVVCDFMEAGEGMHGRA